MEFFMLKIEFLIFISQLIVFSFLNVPTILCKKENVESLPSQIEKVFVRSYYSLTILATTEEIIYNHLKDARGLVTHPAELEWYIEDYVDNCKLISLVKKTKPNSAARMEESKDVIAGHPLLAYRMIYRYVLLLRPLIKDLKLKSGFNVTYLIENGVQIPIPIGWPEKSDVESAMSAILRLQHVYDLNITKFVTGKISNYKTKSFLQAIHCYELSTYALAQRHFALAVEWLEFAKLLVANQIDNTLNLQTLNEALDVAIKTHDLEWDLVQQNEPEFFTAKLKSDFSSFENLNISREKRRTSLPLLWKGERGINFNKINFWRLCSGEDLQTEDEKATLFCWYDTKSNPAWRINPLKIEQLGKTPILLQIYEVLPNSLIEKLINESETSLMNSKVYGGYSGNGIVSTQRTSLNTWMEDSHIDELKPIPRRIELITGLNVMKDSSSEMIQVATYTFGGHYDLHQDVFRDDTEYWGIQKGERIATFMIYLSDVEEGGYTAFPQAGVAAKPVKGSAVFWYNLKRNGHVDENTWHGACPVLQGSKWVSNKWIRTFEQFQTRPCSIDPEE